MNRLIIIDTNIIIRFLLNDHPKLSPKAKIIFQKAEKGEIKLYIDETIIAEVVWTLSSFYKIKKIDIIDKLEKLLSQSWVENPKKKLILMAIELFKDFNLDYIDCWLFVVSKSLHLKLETFDKKLNKMGRR